MFPWNTILVGLLGILMIAYLGGGFKYIVYFHHNPWWNDPIWLEHIVQMGWFNHHLHPWKLTCPLKRDYFSREYIFQPLIFRGHVSFQGGSYHRPHRFPRFQKWPLLPLPGRLRARRHCHQSSRASCAQEAWASCSAQRGDCGGPSPWANTLIFQFYMGVSKNRGTPKWIVYNGKPY